MNKGILKQKQQRELRKLYADSLGKYDKWPEGVEVFCLCETFDGNRGPWVSAKKHPETGQITGCFEYDAEQWGDSIYKIFESFYFPMTEDEEPSSPEKWFDLVERKDPTKSLAKWLEYREMIGWGADDDEL